VAIVPVEPKIERIRYGCDRVNDVSEESLGSAHQASLEFGKMTLIGGADVSDRGGFHTDSTQNAGSSRSNLRHPGKATDARMPMKTWNDATTTADLSKRGPKRKRGPKHRMKILAGAMRSGDIGGSYDRYEFTPPAAGSCPGAPPAMRRA
jgi:hypothetical protein